MYPRYGHLLRHLHSATDQAMSNALASMDLTAAQGRIMAYITHSKKAPCARDIEEVFHLSHPTVSGLLSRLEKKGFLEFRADEQDRRCKRIYIMPKGQEVDETMHRTIMEMDEKLVAGFTEEEKAQFRRLLLKAIENTGDHPCKRKFKEEMKE